jgi:hypothetical protein
MGKLIQNFYKIIKNRILKMVAYLITGVLTFVITLFLILQSPLGQTLLARMAATYLSKELNTEFRIEKLEISSWRTVKLKNLLIRDLSNDTILFSGRFSTTVDIMKIKDNVLKINSVKLINADIRLRMYENDSVMNMRFILDYFSNKDTTVTTSQPQTSIAFSLDHLLIENSHFVFQNQNKKPAEAPIDFDNIEVSNLYVHADDLVIIDDSLSVNIGQISLHEKSGFTVDSLACIYTFSSGYMGAENLKVKTQKNRLDLDFGFSYYDFVDFNDFINKVNINTQIRPSSINLSEVGFFAPLMFNMENDIKLAANIVGTVSNFKAKELKFGLGDNTQFRGTVRMNGLPDITETFSNLTIEQFTTSIKDIRQFRLPTESTYIFLPEILNSLGMVSIDGNFTGFFNDFVSYANFKTDVGQLQTDLLLQVNKANTVKYNGHLKANNFNAGKFLDMENVIKKFDIIATINGSGFNFETMEITMDGVVDSLELFDYVYNHI